jgi:hypothetical protein
MNALSKTMSAAAVLAALAGCASGGYSYSQLDGYRYHKAEIDTYPVLITKVDGQSAELKTPVRVDAGPHVVAVQTYPDRRNSLREERSIDLDVKPCTHYYLVAVKPTSISTDFTVKVDYEEPVAGCTPPAAK